MMHWFILINRQGKVRLAKWFEPFNEKERTKVYKDINNLVLTRQAGMCNFVEIQDQKIVYKRFASLYFVTAIDKDENELLAVDVIQMYVELLDRYFGNVCELDLIFNFDRAYYILGELIISGNLQDTDKRAIIEAQWNADRIAEKTPEFAPKHK